MGLSLDNSKFSHAKCMLQFHGIRKIKYAKHEHNIATHMNVRTHILLIRMKEWAGVLPMILIYRLAMKWILLCILRDFAFKAIFEFQTYCKNMLMNKNYLMLLEAPLCLIAPILCSIIITRGNTNPFTLAWLITSYRSLFLIVVDKLTSCVSHILMYINNKR